MSDTQEHTGVAIMAFVSEADAIRLAAANPTGEPASILHVTLDYLAEPAMDVGIIQRKLLWGGLNPLTQYLPITGDIFGATEFNYGNSADDEHPPCSVLLVQSDWLVWLHDAVQRAVEFVPDISSANSFPIWIPHITLGYNLDGCVFPSPGPVSFDRIGIGYGDEVTFV